MRADRRPRQHRRCGADRLVPVSADVSGRASGSGDLRNDPLAHLKGIRFYKLDMKIFGMPVKKSFFRTPGIPARMEVTLPSVCIVAVLVAVANHFGYGPFTVFPLSHHNEPFMPGDRTCSGGAYTFQIPGALSAQDNVAIPMKIHDAASVRCVFAYVQTSPPPTASPLSW